MTLALLSASEVGRALFPFMTLLELLLTTEGSVPAFSWTASWYRVLPVANYFATPLDPCILLTILVFGLGFAASSA